MKLLALVSVLVGVSVRVALSMHACGSLDVAQAFFWGDRIVSYGFAETYATPSPYPSHAPLGFGLMGLFVSLADGNEVKFGLFLRLATAAVDLLILWMVFRFFARGETRRASGIVILWAVMPYLVIQSSFHGNLDPFVGLLLLMAALLDSSKPAFSGAALGVAACIKIPAFLPLSALAAYHLARSRKEAFHFCSGALLPVAFLLAVPAALISRYFSVLFLGYRGTPDSYGLWALFPSLHEVGWLSTALPLVLIGVASAIVVWRASKGVALKAAEVILCALMPVVFASRGFGIQYFYWFVPLLPLTHRRLWPSSLALVSCLSILNVSMIWDLLGSERCIGPQGYRNLDWLGVVSGGDIISSVEVVIASAVWVLAMVIWSRLVRSLFVNSDY
jgi:hypothetical protein